MFIAAKILALIAQPLHWVIALLLLSVMMPARKMRTSRRLQGAALALLMLMGWTPFSDLVLRQIENQYAEVPASADLSGYAGVVILGGALAPGYVYEGHDQPLLNEAAERMTIAVSLMQRHPKLQVIFTGGEGLLFGSGPSEAQRAKIFFDSLSVSASRVVYESDSRNTYENAIFSARLPGIDINQRWLLLTSATHMPRSMATFAKAGWNVTAFPVDFRTGPSTPWTAFSLGDGAKGWQLGLHEMIGFAAYRLAGRL